jgi:hypothetical protein
MKKPPVPADDRDRELARLRDELFLARDTIIGLMPEPQMLLLEAYCYCETFEEADEWERWVVDGLIELADKRPGLDMGDRSPGAVRAWCPLCGLGASDPYRRGFAVPLGLGRHLLGSHGSQRCRVFRAAAEECYEQLRARERGEPQLQWIGGRPKPWRAPKPAAPKPSAVVLQFRRR